MNNGTTTTYQQQAYEYVRQQILSLTLRPGEYVTDAQVAEKMNISRTPVREAFQRLEKEGLLVNEARRGWRVYALSLEDIYEIFELKIAIEGMVVEKAAISQDVKLNNDLKGALEAMRTAADHDNMDDWLAADVRLHNILFLMADNQRAERIVATLNDQWHRLRIGYVTMQGRSQRSVKEHESFVTKILDGSPDEARALFRVHLEKVRDEMIDLLKRFVIPFSDRGF